MDPTHITLLQSLTLFIEALFAAINTMKQEIRLLRREIQTFPELLRNYDGDLLQDHEENSPSSTVMEE